MGKLPTAREVAAQHGVVGDECVRLQPLFAAGGLSIVHWHCLHDGPALAAERCRPGYSLTLTEAGASMVSCRGRRAVVDPASVVLNNPGEPYRTDHPFGFDDRGLNMTLPPASVHEALATHTPAAAQREGAPFPALMVPAPPRPLLRFRLLAAALARGEAVPALAVEEAGLALLDAAVTGAAGIDTGAIDTGHGAATRPTAADPATRRRHRDQVEAARTFLAERFREPLQLADIARHAAASPYHLARLFRAETGLSLHGTLTRLRLLAAIEPLAAGADSLTELALDLGFSSHSHFTASFRRQLGMTPRQVRRAAARGGWRKVAGELSTAC